MEKQVFKIPDGVKAVKVSQHDDKIVIEFVPGLAWKKGDVLTFDGKSGICVLIFKKHTNDMNPVEYFLLFTDEDTLQYNDRCYNYDFRPATEEEKRLLFDKLKEHGKRWNPDTLELEDIPEELKEGDLAIFWNENKPFEAIIAIYECRDNSRCPYMSNERSWYEHAVKFESMEQYEKVRRGEV